jgi:hypothetical protein
MAVFGFMGSIVFGKVTAAGLGGNPIAAGCRNLTSTSRKMFSQGGG